MTLAKAYKTACRKPRVGRCCPQTSLRVRSTEDEDSPKGYRSPKPATPGGAGRKALFAGDNGQHGFFRQPERPPFRQTFSASSKGRLKRSIWHTGVGRRKQKKAESPDQSGLSTRSLASPARFERAAFRLGGGRSILLSYRRI